MVARDADAGLAGQREQLDAWESALVASGLPVAGLDAPRPKPRLAPAAPLAASVAGEAELVDTWLVERLPRWQVRDSLAPHLPAGYRLVDVYDVWLGEAALPGRVVASVFRALVEGDAAVAAALAAAATAMLAAPSLPRQRRKGETLVAYDLRPFLDQITIEADGAGTVTLRMTLRHDPEKGIGRPEEVLAELGERAGGDLVAGRIVRERLVLGEPVAPPPPPKRGSRRPVR